MSTPSKPDNHPGLIDGANYIYRNPRGVDHPCQAISFQGEWTIKFTNEQREELPLRYLYGKFTRRTS